MSPSFRWRNVVTTDLSHWSLLGDQAVGYSCATSHACLVVPRISYAVLANLISGTGLYLPVMRGRL